MKDRKPSRHHATPPTALPELPAWKAFVVQFNRETQARGPIGGRIEHLSSGRRARFESAEGLLAALEKLLDEVGRGASGNE